MTVDTPGSTDGAPPTGGGALLAVDGAARVAPLRAWGAAARARVSGVVAAALRGWREDWGLEAATGGTAGALGCDSPADVGADAGGWIAAPGASGLWWTIAGAVSGARARAPAALAHAALHAALFAESPVRPPFDARGARRQASVAEDVTQDAWAAWWRAASDALGGDGADVDEAPPAGAAGAWTGALVLTVPWLDLSLRLLVAGERVARLLGPRPPVTAAPRPPLATVLETLRGRRARLRAELEPFELELGALGELRVGDVLRTTHALDTPAVVTVDAGDDRDATRLCRAFLGRAGAARAIELMPDAGGAPRPGGGAGPVPRK